MKFNAAVLSKACRSGAKDGTKNSDLEKPAHYDILDALRTAKLRILGARTGAK